MRAGLTPRMKDYYDSIDAFIKTHGYSPSYEEICGMMGIVSKSVVYHAVRRLAARGYINFIPGKDRSIAICE